jgi:hypothetical protein
LPVLPFGSLRVSRLRGEIWFCDFRAFTATSQIIVHLFLLIVFIRVNSRPISFFDYGDHGDQASSLCYDALEPVLRYIATRLLYMVPVIWLVVSVVSVFLTNREANAGAIRLSHPARPSSSGTRFHFYRD